MIVIGIVSLILFAIVIRFTATKKIQVYGVVVYNEKGEWEYTKYVQASSFKSADAKVRSKMKPGQTYKIEPL